VGEDLGTRHVEALGAGATPERLWDGLAVVVIVHGLPGLSRPVAPRIGRLGSARDVSGRQTSRRASARRKFGKNQPTEEVSDMPYVVDFESVSTVGLESSPVAAALAGLRANEARYFANKYKHEFATVPAADSRDTLDYVSRILREERDIEIAAKPLETSRFQVENLKIAYVFYEDGLSINVMYAVDDPKKRAVGFKLSDGMEVPAELADRFKFARQKTKLAGTIRGSFFVIKGEY
jgi:hypothetical protein